jgi:hypothetical protein
MDYGMTKRLVLHCPLSVAKLRVRVHAGYSAEEIEAAEGELWLRQHISNCPLSGHYDCVLIEAGS